MTHEILIVDDEVDIRTAVAGILRDEGYQARAAGNSDDALAAIRQRVPALLILDVWLQGSRLDGLELLAAVKRDFENLPVVVISGHGTIETAVAAIKMGAYDFVEKPFEADRLLLVVARAIEAARLRRENAELQLRAGGKAELMGSSIAIKLVRTAIDRVAPTGSRVLITGSAGVGKEVVARTLHARSRRSEGPFIVLNAAAMGSDTMEMELFGREADGESAARKVGTLEQAHGGTLLLDEVADMPLGTQGKILRVLQEQRFQRVGGGPVVEIDVRIIASSNRDLQAEIAAGRFREDLYYRLNVVPIRVPPLRERREDIPVFAQHFMARSAQASGSQPRALGKDVLAALQACEWPGNVRQLRNLIDWLLIMAPGNPGSPIRAEMLPPELNARARAVIRSESNSEIMGLPLRDAREVFERQYLSAQLTRFAGNISRTAAFIGMERSALHRKLKSLGIAEEGRSQGHIATDSFADPRAGEDVFR